MLRIIPVGHESRPSMPALSKRFKPLVRALLARIPRSLTLYRLARSYVQTYRGDVTTGMATNGERLLLRGLVGDLQPWVVFDVGSHRGQWAREAISINPNLRLHCFEPTPAAYAQLLKKKFPQNVTCQPVAVSDCEGSETLYTYTGSLRNSLYPVAGLEVLDSLTVQTQAVSAYCEQQQIAQIDLLKIDVEGAELRVLRGALPLLQSGRIGVVQFDYGANFIDARVFLKDMFDLIAGLSYDIYKLYPDGLRRVTGYHTDLECFQNALYVLVRRGWPLGSLVRA